jgi:hypothetical protein
MVSDAELTFDLDFDSVTYFLYLELQYLKLNYSVPTTIVNSAYYNCKFYIWYCQVIAKAILYQLLFIRLVPLYKM